MILFRAGLSFRIDADAARRPEARARYVSEHPAPHDESVSGVASEQVTLAFRRWWAERQPEARWASGQASGLFVIDVSHGHWRDGAFLLTFDEASDAQRFALTFLGRDQSECEAAVEESAGTAIPVRSSPAPRSALGG